MARLNPVSERDLWFVIHLASRRLPQVAAAFRTGSSATRRKPDPAIQLGLSAQPTQRKPPETPADTAKPQPRHAARPLASRLPSLPPPASRLPHRTILSMRR